MPEPMKFEIWYSWPIGGFSHEAPLRDPSNEVVYFRSRAAAQCFLDRLTMNEWFAGRSIVYFIKEPDGLKGTKA